MVFNPYKKATKSSSPFFSGSTEPNMRQELDNTFEGLFPEIEKAQPALLRKMRRDTDNQLIQCACVDPYTKEPSKDRWCSTCHGEGYLWDEQIVDTYRVLKNSDVSSALLDKLTAPGLLNFTLVVFYLRYHLKITNEDKIVRLELDTAGDAIQPYTRAGIYRINNAWDYRSDSGKLEYWKVFTHEESVKYLNAPSYGNV